MKSLEGVETGDLTDHEVSVFGVGDTVVKPQGYSYDSTVVAVFAKLDGQIRVVCESHAIPGMLHIFSPSQIRHA